MKRFLIAATLVAVALGTFASNASAVTIAYKEVGYWQSLAASVNNPTPPITSTNPGKRLKGALAASAFDTTYAFSLNGVALPTLAQTATASKDSVTIAYVRFSTDTSVAVSNTLSSLSYVIEGSGDMVNWYAINTIASNAISASGDNAFSIPLYINVGQGWGTTGTKVSPLLSAKYLRIRFTAGTGLMYAARCELVYFAN